MGGHYRRGLENAERALEIATQIGDDELRMIATYVTAVNRYSLGTYREGVELFLRVVDGPHAHLARRRLGLIAPPYIVACGWLAMCFGFTGDFHRSRVYSARAIEAADALDHPQAQAIAYTMRTIPLTYEGEFAEAVTWGERAVNLCESKRLLLWLPGASSALGWAMAYADRAEAALFHLERGATITERVGIRTHLSQQFVRWSDGLRLAGRREEARRTVDRALELAVALSERGFEVEALHLRGLIAADGDEQERAAAVADLEQAMTLATELGMRLLAARCQLALGRLAMGAGGTARATGYLKTAAALFREMDASFWLARAEAELSGGR